MTESMRRILLALVALGCISSAAEAAQRDQRSGQSASRAAQQAKPPQGQARPAAQATRTTQARPAAQAARTTRAQPRSTTQAQPRRQQASNLRPGDVRTSSGGVLVRGASAATVSRDAPQAARAASRSSRNAVANCTRRNGRTVCAPARSSVAGWQSGLPTANYAQRECPDGTFATLARGHDDVVRCMPF
jgi:hypothetical protein